MRIPTIDGRPLPGRCGLDGHPLFRGRCGWRCNNGHVYLDDEDIETLKNVVPVGGR